MACSGVNIDDSHEVFRKRAICRTCDEAFVRLNVIPVYAGWLYQLRFRKF